jgi:crotonobetainyl-CoA:carnitine CoA-transferase CaiB-like acyl-CoA transferase
VLTDLTARDARACNGELRDLIAAGSVVVALTPFGLEGPSVEPRSTTARYALDDESVVALTGAHAVVATLAAIRWSRRCGASTIVDVAALDVLASCLGNYLPAALCPRARSNGSRGEEYRPTPIQIVPCADGFVGVTASTPEDRAYLAALVGVEAREPTADQVARTVEQWASTRTRCEVFQEAQLWRLPIVPVMAPDEALVDEQCLARSVWDSTAGSPVATSPFRISLGPSGKGRSDAPRSGRQALATARLPLSDVRVLDLGMVWAGPYAGRLLAGLGAEVVKVEGPQRPDGTRRSELGECLGVFADVNRGKTSLVVDLIEPAGRDAFLELVAETDVVLENFSPRVMGNLGLDDAALAARNASLVMLSLPAFGADGPWANHVAYGSGMEVMTGLARRDTRGWPVAAAVPYLDYLSGAYGAAAVLAALLARDRSGAGCHLEIAQREVACQILSNQLARTGQSHSPDARIPGDPCGGQLDLYRAGELAAALVRDHALLARGLLAGQDDSAEMCHHLERLPWRMDGLELRQERDAPVFGADTRRILREVAHLDAERAQALVEAGIVVAASGAPVDSAGARD